MKIESFQGGYDKNFTYIFFDEESLEAAIVDAATPIHQIKPTIRAFRLTPRYLLFTHTHHDHIVYAEDFLSEFPQLEVCTFGKTVHFSNQHSLKDGDKLTLGKLKIQVLHTPGHYIDSVCYLINGAVFTGDTLFVGRTGRTISTGSNTRDLYRSVYQKILTLPGDTVIYPGHHYGNVTTITISENQKISPLLQATDEENFVKRMEDYERSRIRWC